MTQRQGFHPRGGGPRWRPDRPYHVALEDTYIRAHWDEIYTLCKVNSLLFNSTGEVIQNDGLWRVCFGIALTVAGCAARSFTIPSDRSICRP
jgi:hypothetical protein